MDGNEVANLEPDVRFPSGQWTGFFLQYWLPGRHKTDVAMSFATGELSGTGRDWVGPYSVEGTYDVGTGRCAWVKQYRGKHAVAYRGMTDGNGIWGVWEIRQLGGLYVDRGGFHLWPEGSDVSGASEETEKAVTAVMRAEFGSRLGRVLRGVVLLACAVAVALFTRWFWTS